ncbi:hypothetical protein ACFL6C_03890 [Myxococcota bacterium]
MAQKRRELLKGRRTRQQNTIGVVFLGMVVVGIAACDKDADDERPDRISSNVEVESALKLNERESRLVSFAAARILKHSAQARKAITNERYVRAQERVDNALKLVGIIENVLPPTSVETELNSGDLNYQDKEVLSRQLRVPVLESLLRTRDLATDAQVEAARQKDKETASALVQPESQPEKTAEGEVEVLSRAEGNIAADETPTVRDVEYVDETIDLDVTFAKQQLMLASKQLLDDKPKEADEALDRIEAKGLSVDIAILDVPLEAVADNLAFAEYEISHGRAREAKAALKTASEELQRYVKDADDESEEVKKMHEEIDDLAEEIHEKMASNETLEIAHEKVAHWWNRAWQWVTQSDT